jgi:predicted ATP-grasp superfamily ATP-dependent carboligase
MLVLVMGHRLALARALEKLEIPYLLWSEKPVLNKLKAGKVILSEFPTTKEEVLEQILDGFNITHVIAAVEKSVIPASNIRLWFKLKRNPHNLILKCTDKYKMKSYLFEKNIPMTEFCSGRKLSQDEIIEKVGWPVISKPRLSSGGRGIMFLNSKEEMALNKSSQCYYEKAITGTEGSIESFIHNNKIVFSNITEYFKNGYCNKVPGRYSEEIVEKIKNLNKDVLEALNIKWGMTHLEYYNTETGLYFGEVALRPPGGHIMDALSMAYNIDSWELFIKVELNLLDNCEVFQKSFSSTVLIHPGEGIIKKIEGVEEVQSLKSIQKFKLNIKVGDTIGKREGVGQNYGHAFFCNESSAELDKDLNKFYSKLKIHLV